MDRHFVSLEFLSGPADRFCYNPKWLLGIRETSIFLSTIEVMSL